MPAQTHGHYAFDAPRYVPLLASELIATARSRLFELIDQTPNLDWLLLTKRPDNVMPLYGNWLHWQRRHAFPPNVWIGASVENQRRLEERAPHLVRLRQFGLRVAFFSAEPLLEAIDCRPWLHPTDGVNWVIVGGESGAEARPFDPMWAGLIIDQCHDAGVAAFVKQMGANPAGLTVRGKGGDVDDIPENLRVREFPAIGA